MRFLITAGGTREYIDPVRYISNASTGRMGYSLARAAVKAGADVTLITAVTNLEIPEGVKAVRVVSSADMYEAVKEHFAECDCLVMAAAVSDYRPVRMRGTKIKKGEMGMTLELKPTKDILKWAGKHKKRGQFVVGFALEDKDLMKNAEKKLIGKQIDMIIANSVEAIGAEESTVYIKRIEEDWAELAGKKGQMAEKIIERILKEGFAQN